MTFSKYDLWDYLGLGQLRHIFFVCYVSRFTHVLMGVFK